MRRLLLVAAVVIAAAAGFHVWSDAMITKSDNAALNLTRPCSYSGKVPTTISVSGTSAATSSAMTVNKGIRFVCNTAVHFRMSTTASPTAVSTDSFLPANTVEWFMSEGDYVAAIQDAASGTCYLTECR